MEKRMLWLGLIIMVIGLCTSGALATTMGPPVAGLDTGQFGIGFDYSNTDIDIELDGKGTEHLEVSGPIFNVDDAETYKFKFDDSIESNMYLANLGYGISDKLEVDILLGMADLSFSDSDLDGGSDFAYGFGVKATFYEEADLKIGVLLQMIWGSSDDEFTDVEDIPESDECIDVAGTFDIDYYQLKFAVGPSYKMSEGVSIYGGPFYYMFSGDWDVKGVGEADVLGHEVLFTAHESGDIEEDSSFGGYIGARIDITEKLPVSVEYQFTGGGGVFGASLLYKF